MKERRQENPERPDPLEIVALFSPEVMRLEAQMRYGHFRSHGENPYQEKMDYLRETFPELSDMIQEVQTMADEDFANMFSLFVKNMVE